MAINQRLPGTNLMPLLGMASQLKTKTFGNDGGLTLPTGIFQDCISALPVFGDLSDDEPLKNDFTVLLDMVFPVGSTVQYFLIDDNCEEIVELKDDTYGQFYQDGFWPESSGFTFFQSSYKGMRLDWQKVLLLQGHGVYKIKKVFTSYNEFLEPIIREECSCQFDLCSFTSERADETIRIETIQNGSTLEPSGLDYTGMNWVEQIRIPGFFGEKQRRLEQDDYLNKARRTEQIQDSIVHEFTLEPYFWPPCLRELIDGILLANNILISDYNILNTDDLKNISVKPVSIDTEYFGKSPKAADSIKFEERILNRVKRNVR